MTPGSGRERGNSRSGGDERSGGSRRGGPRVDRARRTAYEVMHAVSTRDAFANLALSSALRDQRLPARDAAFVTELVNGTLRRRGGYDDIIARCVDRPLGRLDAGVVDVLRLGAHQLLGMRVPAHAAVGTSVDLARQVAGVGPSKLVNAVLRQVGARDLAGWHSALAPPRDTDPIGHLATTTFHPRWVVEAFHTALDGSHSETAAALDADNEPPRVTLAAWPGRSTVAELGGSPGRWSPYAAVLLEGGDPGSVPAVAEHRAGVIDEGSQLVAVALARAALVDFDSSRGGSAEGADWSHGSGGSWWLDLCAGPGGKAALLSGLAGEHSARLLAAERRWHRAELVRDGTTGPVVCADGLVPPWRPGRFDRVLADVPCSGLGALRRRPESRWRRCADDIEELHPLQVGLLRSALNAVRPGGVVAYVTCSPHPRETRQVVEEVLADRPADAEPIDARPYLPGVPDLGPGPTIQLWPHRHGTDAMYLALIRRTTRLDVW